MTREEANKLKEDIKNISDNPLFNIISKDAILYMMLEKIDRLTESEDCRNCKKWNECPCGKEGHENGTSISYSIGECKDYEPCDDAVSREAVLSLQTEYAEKMGATTFWKLRDDIRALPSVTPQRPKGKWIDIRVIKSFHYDGEPRVRCSRCGNEEEWSSNYCPNCGAEMEVEE